MGNTLCLCIFPAFFSCPFFRSFYRWLAVSVSALSFSIETDILQIRLKYMECDTSLKWCHQLTCILFCIYIKSISHTLSFQLHNCKNRLYPLYAFCIPLSRSFSVLFSFFFSFSFYLFLVQVFNESQKRKYIYIEHLHETKK